MSKPRPNRHHRDIAEYIYRLPLGKHVIDVRSDFEAVIKPEGGLIINHEGNNITIAQGGMRRVESITPGKAKTT